VSISSTFFARIFRTKRRFGSFFLVTCTLKKLPKRRSYKKRARKTLMKLTAGHGTNSSGILRPTLFLDINADKREDCPNAKFTFGIKADKN
jgi:hypothetical protein